MKNKVVVYDNPKTYDRYTVIINDDFFGMSKYGSGFNMFLGSKADGYKAGKHLGKKLKHIPNSIKQAVKNRMEA